MRLACLSLLCFSLAALLPLRAQEENGLFAPDTLPDTTPIRLKPLRFLELGVSANSYQGDLSGYEKLTSCYHIALRFNEAKRLNGRLGFGFGFVTGDSRFYKFTGGKPNNFFRSPIYTLTYEWQYNFIKTRSFMLYGSLGFGLFNYQPKNEKGEKLIDLLETRAIDEIYGRVSMMLPIGLGATYILKNGYGVGLQATLLNTQTDYIDNISQWSTKSGNDNIASFRFYIYAPLQFLKLTTKPNPKQPKRPYTYDIAPY